MKGITGISSDLILYAPPAGALAAAGKAAGLTVCAEGFADRRYLENGALMPRAEPGAVIYNVEEAVAQAMEIVANGTVETLCVHGDGPTAVAILRPCADDSKTAATDRMQDTLLTALAPPAASR